MIISIDTAQPLSEQDIALLKILLPSADWPPAEKPKPAKKTAAKKPTKKAEPEPEPEPEPATDGPTLDQAVEAARNLLDAGEREKVMSALKDLGVGRVSDLPVESVPDFLEAIA